MFVSCDDDGEDNPTVCIVEDDFNLIRTWNFQTVDAEGQIGGVDQSDKDNNPSGFVTFNEDGTGIFDFEINLLSRDFGKIDPITWTRESDKLVRIIESDGDVLDWNLIRANEGLVEASWHLSITSADFATFTAVLTPE